MSHVQSLSKYWILLIVIVVVAAAASCSTGKPAPAGIREQKVKPDSSGKTVYLEPAPTDSRTVISKNYTIGGRRRAAVGEPVVGVRNYTAAERVTSATVLRDFRQLCEVPTPPKQEKKPAPVAGDGPAGVAEDEVGEDGAVDVESSDTSLSAQPQRASSASTDSGILDSLERYACRQGVLGQLRATKGTVLAVPGAFKENGEFYYLLEIPTDEGAVFLSVDRRGRVKPDRYAVRRKSADKDVITPRGIPLTYLTTRGPLEITLEPGEAEDPYDVPSRGPTYSGPVVRFQTSEAVLPHGDANRYFDLIYDGTSYDHRGMVYHILYKEYRRDNPEVALYTKTLAYTADQTTIDLLGFRIRVHDVNETGISYTVERD